MDDPTVKFEVCTYLKWSNYKQFDRWWDRCKKLSDNLATLINAQACGQMVRAMDYDREFDPPTGLKFFL